jgi:hypothetical protein
VTDDTTAILAALATGRSIYFPQGIYQVSADLTFSAQVTTAGSGRVIYGEGMGGASGGDAVGSVIRLTGTANGFKCSDSLPYVSFRDIGIIGDAATGRGIWFTGTAAECLFQNVSVYTGDQAVYMPNTGAPFGSSFSMTFVNCYFSSHTASPVEVAGGPGTNFVGCYAVIFPVSAGIAGWRVYSQANFYGCNSVTTGGTAVIAGQWVTAGDAVNTDAYVNFTGCNFESFSTAGVECRNGGVFTFRDCLFAGAGAYTASIIQNFNATSLQPIVVDRCTFFNSTTNFQPFSGASWQISSYYPVGAQVQNGTRLYKATVAGTSAGAGGPTGTGTGIVDGGVTWDFLANAAPSRTKRAELYAANGGQSNFVVRDCPSLGAKPQVDFAGSAIFNAAGSGSMVNLDGVNSVNGRHAELVHGPLVLAGPAVAAGSVAANTTVLGNVTQTTVGAAGAATALPAQPTGYIVGYRNGTKIAVPYYLAA